MAVNLHIPSDDAVFPVPGVEIGVTEAGIRKANRRDLTVFRLSAVLRYIHANPLAAKMLEGFDYAYSNYASYARLKDDGLTVWHPAFLKLERSLDACVSVYAAFCKRYQSKAKPNPRSRWGVWQLWQEVNKRTKSTKKSSTQTDLFAQNGARYHGGSQTVENRLNLTQNFHLKLTHPVTA